MAVQFKGGCVVSALREDRPWMRDGVSVWQRIGRAVGADAITLRVVELAPGRSPGIRTPACDDVMFVFSGSATLYIDGWPFEVEPDAGFYLPAGSVLTVDNPGPEPLVLVSSQCPDPQAEPCIVSAVTTPAVPKHSTPPLARLSERDLETTSDRWYAVLVDASMGSTQVTQFIGSIPPGRAPDHFHHYEEAICVLQGRGRMWAQDQSTTIARGSCIFLPRRQIHCLENTGDGPLKLLGVFYPAGSPAERDDA